MTAATSPSAFHERFKGRLSLVTRTGGHIRVDSQPAVLSSPPANHRLERRRRRRLHSLGAPAPAPAPAPARPAVDRRTYLRSAPTPVATKPTVAQIKREAATYVAREARQHHDEQVDDGLSEPDGPVDGAQTPAKPARRKTASYRPYGIRDYRRLPEKVELGKLGPDLDSEDLIRKRMANFRMQEFARQQRLINLKNLRRAQDRQPHAREPKKPTATQRSARQRALEFAATIPVPRAPAQRPAAVPKPTTTSGHAHASSLPRELELLSRQHEEGVGQVEAIRRELCLATPGQ